jgi:hypothetical protein
MTVVIAESSGCWESLETITWVNRPARPVTDPRRESDDGRPMRPATHREPRTLRLAARSHAQLRGGEVRAGGMDMLVHGERCWSDRTVLACDQESRQTRPGDAAVGSQTLMADWHGRGGG